MSRFSSCRLGQRARLFRVPLLGAVGAISMLEPACLSRPIETLEPHRTSTIVETLSQSRVDKIDIVLGIDDSGSMADKQALLARAVPDLIGSLLNPPCLGDDGAVVSQPDGPLVPCPTGHREFDPILDIHIGVLSTSLGQRGSPVSCSDDDGRFLQRDASGGVVPTYGGKGFLAWDPAQTLEPKGEADVAAFGTNLANLVGGVGQKGCGYEAQLESWYRFLVDPDPYSSVEQVKNDQGAVIRTELRGTDAAVIQERADFLRADSLVSIIMLTDENDCSFRAEGQGFLTADAARLKQLKARKECETDITDKCCAPCGYAPSTCPDDPTCSDPLPEDHDYPDLDCFDQKRRFGVDLLYSVNRYIDGLTGAKVPNRAGELVDNPLFVSSATGETRTRDRVFLAGIVGVPWQDIARPNASGEPDLAEGLKTSKELVDTGVWDVILGDPAKGIAPTDPHMIESMTPRSDIAPSSSDSPGADPISGHEYEAKGDLQYACIFDLPAEFQRDCESTSDSCDCRDPDVEKKPLCQDAATGAYGTTQLRAKAYPGRRELSVLKGIGDQGIVASICPAEVKDSGAPDYGYRPAVGALVNRLKEKLEDPCLPRSFTTNDEGQVNCLVLEGRKIEASGDTCDCSGTARSPVSGAHSPARDAARSTPSAKASGLDCFCEVDQLAGEELLACQTSLDEQVKTPEGTPVDGFCYVDATIIPAIGEPALVAHCPATEKRTIRLVGAGEAVNKSTLFITCQQSSD